MLREPGERMCDMGVQQRLRDFYYHTYTPADRAEREAHEMWLEAAGEGGLYWGAMVGNYTQVRGATALSRACPCAEAVELIEGSDGPRHQGHAALRVEAVRDVFEKTLRRRIHRLGRWTMRHSNMRR